MVTVSSAQQSAPKSIFAMSQRTSDSDGFLTIGCLARGFSPADSVTFKWKNHADKELSDFVQYPAVGRDGDYTKISHMRVRKSEWDPQKPYKCEASNSKGKVETRVAPAPKRVNKPTIALLSRKDGDRIVLECQLNDYFPDKLTVQWLEGDRSARGQIDKKFQNTDKGEKNYTYISQLPISAPYEDKKYTCKATFNSEEIKKEYNMCEAQSLFKPSVQIKRSHLRDIIQQSTVTVACVVEAPDNTKVSWLADSIKKPATKEVKDPSNNIVSNLTLSRSYIKKDPVVVIRTLMKSAQADSAVLECVVNDLPSGEVCINFQANKVDISDLSCVDWTPSENVWYLTKHFTIPSEHQKDGKVFTCKVHRLFKSWTSQSTENIFGKE
ncbi:immunoglobulin delta heavy [Labeo rohita]|nr:immunoglobulin delta heavy [Labeo rohita]